MSTPVWSLIKYAYRVILRPLLVKAIDDPNADWDDWALFICDKIFGYEEG